MNNLFVYKIVISFANHNNRVLYLDVQHRKHVMFSLPKILYYMIGNLSFVIKENKNQLNCVCVCVYVKFYTWANRHSILSCKFPTVFSLTQLIHTFSLSQLCSCSTSQAPKCIPTQTHRHIHTLMTCLIINWHS